ncbi:MAG TPA: CBS domain-containing protein [Nitrososphaerales archaeon]|nr:CBS domain-containing protein [Nitrososphaerales archaeon]
MNDINWFRLQSIREIVEERQLFPESERVSKAVGHLRESGDYEVFIAQGHRYLSLTTRDLMYTSDPAKTRLGTIAYQVPEVPKNGTIVEAARLMYDHRLRALPCKVEPVAFNAATARGILRQLNGSVNMPMRASEIMSRNPVVVDAGDTVSKARKVMTKRRFDHLPVTNGSKLTGILTSSDILFHLMGEERAPARGDSEVRFDYPVARISQESFIEVEPTATVSQVVGLMVEKKTTAVLVSQGDGLKGIITLRDIMKPLVGPREENLRYYIVGLPREPSEAEAVKGKFERLSSSLAKAFPYIEEVRAVIDTKKISDQKARYEVSVDIYMPKERFAFSEEGYDLEVVFESLGAKIKKLISSKRTVAARGRGDRR